MVVSSASVAFAIDNVDEYPDDNHGDYGPYISNVVNNPDGDGSRFDGLIMNNVDDSGNDNDRLGNIAISRPDTGNLYATVTVNNEQQTTDATLQNSNEVKEDDNLEKAKVDNNDNDAPENPESSNDSKVDADAKDSASANEDIVGSAKSDMKNTGLPAGIIVLLISALLIAIRIKK